MSSSRARATPDPVTDAKRSPRRFPVVLTLVCAVAVAVLIALGVWQLQRMAWKQDLLARLAAAETAQPVSLDEALARPDPAFARVVLTCRGLDRAPYVELHAIMEGEGGSRLVSLCSDEAPILIDRGFVAETISARPPEDGGTMPVSVIGVLRRSEAPNAFTPAPRANRYFARDIAAMAEGLGASEARTDLMVVGETSSNPEWLALRPAALPAGLSNNHLGYALTWFGLAAALLGVYVALLRRKSGS